MNRCRLLFPSALLPLLFTACVRQPKAEAVAAVPKVGSSQYRSAIQPGIAGTVAPPAAAPYLLLVSFYTPMLRDLSVQALDALNRSPYDGVAALLRGSADTSHRSEADLDSAIARIKANTTKRVWPWIFVNRIVGTAPDGVPPETPSTARQGFSQIEGMDLWNKAGALEDFYSQWRLALVTAKKLGAPGIVVDHEAYNNYRSYNIAYLARRSGRSERDVVAQLEAIGARLSDITDAEYPSAVVWFLSAGLLSSDQSGAYRQRAGAYIALGMLQRARQTHSRWTVVAGGEQAFGYCFLSLTDLNATISRRDQGYQPLIAAYPRLAQAGTIAPWADASARTDWLRQDRCGRSSLKTADDFVPLFRRIFQRYSYVWIYAAMVAPYNPYDSVAAAPYNRAIRAALP